MYITDVAVSGDMIIGKLSQEQKRERLRMFRGLQTWKEFKKIKVSKKGKVWKGQWKQG